MSKAHSLYSQQWSLYLSFSLFPDCNNCSFLRHTTSAARTDTCVQRRRKTIHTQECWQGGNRAQWLSFNQNYIMQCMYVHPQTRCQDLKYALVLHASPYLRVAIIAQQQQSEGRGWRARGLKCIYPHTQCGLTRIHCCSFCMYVLTRHAYTNNLSPEVWKMRQEEPMVMRCCSDMAINGMTEQQKETVILYFHRSMMM